MATKHTHDSAEHDHPGGDHPHVHDGKAEKYEKAKAKR